MMSIPTCSKLKLVAISTIAPPPAWRTNETKSLRMNISICGKCSSWEREFYQIIKVMV